MALAAGIVMHFFAIVIEHGLRTPSIFEAMQMHLDAGGVKEADLMEKIEDASVVDGVWHIQAHDM
jgi:hypothetical protein